MLFLSSRETMMSQRGDAFPTSISSSLKKVFSHNGVLGGSVVTFDRSGYHSFSYGDAFPDSIPFTDSTFLRIASISKMFTGMALLQLVKEGKVELDHDVNSYLDFKLMNPAYLKVPITIRMLLNHTSTLQDSREILSMAKKAIYRDTLNPEKLIPDIRELFTSGNNHFLPRTIKLAKGEISRVIPGSYFHYTNLNFVIIAHIIERIEQQPFHAVIKNKLLDRYAIPGGFIVQEIPVQGTLSPQYLPKGNTWIPEADAYTAPYDSIFTSITDYVPGRNVLRFSPQAGMRVSSHGLATFFRSFLSDSKISTIKTMMFQSSWKAKSNNNSHQFDNLFKEWGLACHIINEKQVPFAEDFPWIGHIGRANGAYTLMYMSPQSQKGIVIFINGKRKQSKGSIGFESIEKEIMNIILNKHWRKE
jgi:CubicO group peptidase (beta-lactamase class C family)